ncbi:MAG: hypothetical protein IJ766_02495 [Clostridia bacterium]|nr:hypothetical protein [Clostridia bacterium]
MRKSTKTALGGIIAALSLVLMLLTSVIPFLSYALPALAGVSLMIMVMEIDRKWAFAAYATISMLSLFLLADKEAAVMYAAFFGYYPILKSVLEEKLNRVAGFIIKLLVFNAAVAVAIIITTFVFKIPLDGLDDFGKYSIPILIGLAELTFVIYDYALSRFVILYMRYFRKYVRRIFK